MKIITIYELLGMIKDNNAPKRIRQGCEYYEFLEENNDYLQKGSESYCLFSDKYDIALACRLNDEVEIIEEEKKIPEKLEYVVSDENGEFSINGFTFDYEQKMQIIDTINQVIDCLKSKGE